MAQLLHATYGAADYFLQTGPGVQPSSIAVSSVLEICVLCWLEPRIRRRRRMRANDRRRQPKPSTPRCCVMCIQGRWRQRRLPPTPRRHWWLGRFRPPPSPTKNVRVTPSNGHANTAIRRSKNRGDGGDHERFKGDERVKGSRGHLFAGASGDRVSLFSVWTFLFLLRHTRVDVVCKKRALSARKSAASFPENLSVLPYYCTVRIFGSEHIPLSTASRWARWLNPCVWQRSIPRSFRRMGWPASLRVLSFLPFFRPRAWTCAAVEPLWLDRVESSSTTTDTTNCRKGKRRVDSSSWDMRLFLGDLDHTVTVGGKEAAVTWGVGWHHLCFPPWTLRSKHRKKAAASAGNYPRREEGGGGVHSPGAARVLLRHRFAFKWGLNMTLRTASSARVPCLFCLAAQWFANTLS